MGSICDFVNEELYHNATTNRYLHRFFLCNEIGTNFHDITTSLNYSNQDDSTWTIRIQCFPKLEYKVGNYLMEHCYKKVITKKFRFFSPKKAFFSQFRIESQNIHSHFERRSIQWKILLWHRNKRHVLCKRRGQF